MNNYINSIYKLIVKLLNDDDKELKTKKTKREFIWAK